MKHPNSETKRLHESYRRAFQRGDYGSAETEARKLLILARKGNDQKLIATALHDLGTIMISKNHFQEALELLKESLEYKLTTNSEKLSIAATLNQLAQVYSISGHLETAEKLYRQVLSTFEEVGDMYSSAITFSNLGSVMASLERYKEAEIYYMKALEIQNKLGDVQSAKTLNNISKVYLDSGRIKEAEEYLKKSLSIMEKMLGEEHPDTLLSVVNLAILFEKKGDLEKAIPLFEKGLNGLIKTLGYKHPYVENLIKQKETLTRQ